MAEELGGLISDDDWFESDYMDAEDYRNVHGDSNVGDFSWSGQDMWNTSPAQSNDMHGLLGGGFNAFTDTTNNTVTGSENVFGGNQGLLQALTPVEQAYKNVLNRNNKSSNRLAQRFNQNNTIKNVDVTSPLTQAGPDLGMFPAAHKQPSFADKMANMNKGLVGGIEKVYDNTLRNPVNNWLGNVQKSYNTMVGVADSTKPYDSTRDVQRQMGGNVWSDLANAGVGVVDMISNPLAVAKEAVDLTSGAFQNTLQYIPGMADLSWNLETEKKAEDFGKAISETYGTLGGFKKELAERPVSTIGMITGLGYMAKAASPVVGKGLLNTLTPEAVDKWMMKTPGIVAEKKMSIAPTGVKISTIPGIAAHHGVDLGVLKSKLATHAIGHKEFKTWDFIEQKHFIDNAPDTIKAKGKDAQKWGRGGQMLTERQIRGQATKDLASSLRISDTHLKSLANKKLGITIEQFKTLSFDDQKLAVQIGKGFDKPMGVGHNLSQESFLKQLEGLPMPSMWIANANNPLTKFGDITLVGNKNLIDRFKTNVHPSDMYSGRQPGSRLAYSNMDEIANIVDEKTLDFYGYYTVDALTPGGLEGKLAATREYVETINPKTNRYFNPDEYKSYSEMKTAARRSNIYIDEPFVGKENYLGETHHTIMNVKGKEVPWNVEDVMKVMRKKKAHLTGTEGLTGASQARAVASEKFKNISDVKANRDRLSDQLGGELESVHLWKSKHEDAVETVGRIAETIGEKYEFGHLDKYGSIIEDSIKGDSLAWTGWPADKLAEVKVITDELKALAKTLDTDYFEAKTKSVVDISEFKGAIIPEGATEVEKLLIEKGVTKILKYGTEKERVGLFKQFPELFFNTAPIGIGAGYMGYGEPTGLMDELQ